jgi:hypothetical protein
VLHLIDMCSYNASCHRCIPWTIPTAWLMATANYGSILSMYVSLSSFVCVLLFSSWVTQSCIHMVLEFVSPESLQECLQLTSEFRCLPKSHHANKDKLEVGWN